MMLVNDGMGIKKNMQYKFPNGGKVDLYTFCALDLFFFYCAMCLQRVYVFIQMSEIVFPFGLEWGEVGVLRI